MKEMPSRLVSHEDLGYSTREYAFQKFRPVRTGHGPSHLNEGHRSSHSFVPSSVRPSFPRGRVDKASDFDARPVVRARFEPRRGRPHFAPTCNGVRVCGRDRTEAKERERAEGTVSILSDTLNFRIKFCHSTGIARSGGGVRASTTSYA